MRKQFFLKNIFSKGKRNSSRFPRLNIGKPIKLFTNQNYVEWILLFGVPLLVSKLVTELAHALNVEAREILITCQKGFVYFYQGLVDIYRPTSPML